MARAAAGHRVAPMLYADVVPHHDVARPPLVGIAGRVRVEMGAQRGEQSIALVTVDARDTIGEVVHEQCSTTSVRMRGEHRMHRIGQARQLRRRRQAGVEVDDLAVLELAAQLAWERLVRGVGIAELGGHDTGIDLERFEHAHDLEHRSMALIVVPHQLACALGAGVVVGGPRVLAAAATPTSTPPGQGTLAPWGRHVTRPPDCGAPRGASSISPACWPWRRRPTPCITTWVPSYSRSNATE